MWDNGLSQLPGAGLRIPSADAPSAGYAGEANAIGFCFALRALRALLERIEDVFQAIASAQVLNIHTLGSWKFIETHENIWKAI